MKGPPRKWTPERVRALHALHEAGMPVAQIARENGIHAPNVYYLFKREGLPTMGSRTGGHRGGGRQNIYTDDDIARALRRVAAEIGRSPGTHAYGKHRRDGEPASITITKRMKWNDALRMAGLTPNTRPPGNGMGERHYSDDAVLAAVRRVAREVGRAPTYAEYEQHGRRSEPSVNAVRDRFGGTWPGALRAAGLPFTEVAA
jgi:transposase-like protein